MSRLFGWSYPPGCTSRDVEEAMGVDQPCDVCGKMADDCICPECTVCGAQGDPKCYPDHYLVETHEQLESRKAYEDQCAADAKAEAEYWERYANEIKDYGDKHGE